MNYLITLHPIDISINYYIHSFSCLTNFFSLSLGNSCLIEETRYWYTGCNETNALISTTHYPGNTFTDPVNIPYWFYTHFGLNILWIITILLLLTPTGDSNKKGKGS